MLTRFLKIQIFIGLIAVAIIIPSISLAQLKGSQLQSTDCLKVLGLNCGTNDTFDTIGNVIFIIIRGFLSLVGVVSFGVFVYCGVMYIMSHGEEEIARRAKACMTYAVIGIFIAGFSGIIINSIINIGN